ncbi:hypothetical protein RJT34_01446 [Clitoria ternatea]|uniref:argininosuccinate synthase n=1 Tax=Clitoria ternatea TaxID=43366 RepID=A0AAN9KH42_CLITE
MPEIQEHACEYFGQNYFTCSLQNYYNMLEEFVFCTACIVYDNLFMSIMKIAKQKDLLDYPGLFTTKLEKERNTYGQFSAASPLLCSGSPSARMPYLGTVFVPGTSSGLVSLQHSDQFSKANPSSFKEFGLRTSAGTGKLPVIKAVTCSDMKVGNSQTTNGSALRGKLNKVVLAYSGGLDTSVIVPWLRENYGCEVVCFTADVGQKAKASGACQLVVKDLREEFVSDYIFPCLRAGAVYERKYLLGTSMARHVIAKAMVDVAKEVGADAVSHGCTRKGNDQVHFELTFFSLNPKLNVVAPWREWDITGREDAIEYAKKHNVPVPVTKKSMYSWDRNLWHLSHEAFSSIWSLFSRIPFDSSVSQSLPCVVDPFLLLAPPSGIVAPSSTLFLVLRRALLVVLRRALFLSSSPLFLLSLPQAYV